MLNNDIKDNILTLPDNESFPVNYGEKSPNANKLFKKEMDEVVLNYFDQFIFKDNGQKCVIVIGAPGVGKVIIIILLSLYIIYIRAGVRNIYYGIIFVTEEQ